MKDNQIDLILENWHEELRMVEKNNVIAGERQIPSQFICTLY